MTCRQMTKQQLELLREIAEWDYPDGVWLEQLAIWERSVADALIRRGLAETTGEGGKLCATRAGHRFMNKYTRQRFVLLPGEK